MTGAADGRALAMRLHRKMLGAGVATILRYLDNQDRPDRQTEACEIHASDLSAELTVIEPKALVLIAPLDDFSLTK